MIKAYEVKGMTCVICKRNVERALNNLGGVNSAVVNILDNEVTIDYDEKSINKEQLATAVKNAGYSLIINDKKRIDIDNLISIISIILVVILMIIAMNNSLYSIQLIIATTIILLNINIYKSGIRSLIKLNPNMNSLVFISSFISYLYSIYSLNKINNGNTNYNLYFETSAMVLVIVSIGKKIESNTKSKTTKAIKGLASLIPMQANLLKDNNIKTISINDIKKDDIVRVFPGDSLPQDGIIIKGTTSIDESMITGESLPTTKSINDEVIGGTVNLVGTIDVKISKSNNMSIISNIINLTKQVTMKKLPIERITDKISNYFVFSIIVVSILTFSIWILIKHDFELALNFALSVLVISCPCALGLATPSAIGVASGVAARNGLLIKKPEILELAHKTKTIILDKTGTLTKNKLSIVKIEQFDDDFINILSSIEKTSDHPIAKAIKEKYNVGSIEFDKSVYYPGEGIKAYKDTDEYCAGNKLLINNIGSKYLEYANANNYSYIAVSKNNNVLGVVYLSDIIRETSKVAISNLKKREIKTIVCTGDNEISAKKISSLLDIKEYISNVKPDDKNDIVNNEKKNGIVMMVGDGVNDSIALANADISVCLKNSSDIASASSDVILMKNNLNDISFLYDLSSKTMSIIKQNLLWSLGYNSVCIPIAAGVFFNSFNLKLNPMIGASAMWVSSMFVLLNALRINNVKKEEITFMNKTVFIDGMMCEHCKKHVEDALTNLGLEARVYLEEKKAIILNTSIDDETLTKAILDAGYEVKEIKND